MSQISTPAQSFMLSASSTPVKGGNGMQPDQLTPRSKIKALLAALDSSDDDKLSESTSNVPGDARARLAQTLKIDSNKTVGNHRKGSGDEDDDESEGSGDEDDMVAPRGKLASRLYGQRTTKQDLPHDTTEACAASTSDQTERGLPQKPHSFIKESVEEVTSDLSEKGNGITRKFLKRRKRPLAIDSASSQSRSKSPPSQRPSPALSLTPRKPGASSSNEPLPGLLLTPNLGRSSTPRKSISGSHGSDSDLPSDPNAKSRFLALVARKREERQAREVAERRKKQEKSSRLEVDMRQSAGNDEINRMGISEDDSENEAVGERKLTQQSRPTRKASKKALEEMKRETQRMSRNMQLAHQAKTKKKIRKESLLARFNFGGDRNPTTNVVKALSSSIVGSSTHVSDIEEAKEQETPPTSPILPLGNEYLKAGVAKDAQPIISPIEELHDEVGDELPSTEDTMTHSVQRLNKGKGKAIEEPSQNTIINSNKVEKQNKTRRPIKVRLPDPSDRQKGQQSDSESDLEIIPTNKLKSKQRDIFDRLPTQKVVQTRSLQTLRALAHLTSPSKQKSNSRLASITPVEMQASLQKLARQQAARERAEKIQDLKDRGVIIHTAEEIERDQGDLQDLLEKARKDAEQITKKEKDAAKKERRDNGETVLDDSSEDEEEYREEKAKISEVEFSGSEDEEEDGEEEKEEEKDEELSDEEDEEGIEGVILTKNKRGVENLIDNEAPEDSQEEDEEDDDDDDNDDGDGDRDGEIFVEQNKRRNKISRVIDEEDEEDDLQQDSNYTDPPQNPFIPNLHGCIDAPMGLTQAFAATMADSQTQSGGITRVADEEQDSLAFLRGMPEVDFPMIDADVGESMVINSQPDQFSLRDTSPHESGNTEINLHLTQSQIDRESKPEATEHFEFATQYSQIPDPTQDVGFGLFSPIANRFVSVPPSTIETVVLPKADVNEAIIKKKGRLRRRLEATPVLSNVDDETIPSGLQQNEFTISANAFDVLKKASKKDLPRDESFIKDKSNAKGMIEEQAEESEDEYAGLGGASDDESGNEEDEEVRKMMDDGDVKLDERKLAAFHANKERVSDEKAVEKLFKDINNGMLRKKRGAEFDLSDSDDDIEARRKAKRRQFTKMRKALLENENVGKIAEDPKKLAFLRAIEDREDGGELDFLEQPDEPSQPDSTTQEDSQSQDIPISAETIGTKRKRPLQESLPDAANRPPPHARRIQKIKKPSSLAEIRASVSFLIEEPNALPQHPYSDSSDNEDAHPQEPSASLQKDLPNPHRRTTQPIIDRLVLKRAESASGATSSTSSSHRLAFLNPNTSHTEAPGFKVPNLLRRATTQNLDSANAYGITTATATAIVGTERAAGGGESTGVRKGGSKRSSVNWFSREEERRRVLEGRAGSGSRRDKGRGGGGGRRGVGGLGGLVGGVFE